MCDLGRGLGPSGSACSTVEARSLEIEMIPQPMADFRLVLADLSGAASEVEQAILDLEVMQTLPSGESMIVSVLADHTETFIDGLDMCQQLPPFICSETPTNLNCNLQFYACHADLTKDLNQYIVPGEICAGE